MVVDDALPDCPEETIGLATAGSLQGCYVLLERLTTDSWLVYWRNPQVPDERMRPGQDAGDDLLGTTDQAVTFLRESGVRWLSDQESTELRDRYFSSTPERRTSIAERLQRLRRSSSCGPTG